MTTNPDPERIWLAPVCCDDPHTGRHWAPDPSPWPCQDCLLGAEGVEYVRADLLNPIFAFLLSEIRWDDNDRVPCDACGRPTHAVLLDSKPDPNDPPNWNRIECRDCYGPGWDCVYPEGHYQRRKAEALTRIWRIDDRTQKGGEE